jgi:hypothetical protein
VGKFRRNWTSAARSLEGADGDRLLRLVDDLEAVNDVRELVDLACGSR